MPATYEPIASTTVSGTPADITFSSIASTWTDLLLIVHVTNGGSGNLFMQLNGDTAGNYSTTLLRGTGTAASSTRLTNTTSGIKLTDESMPTNTAYTQLVVHFQSYANTNVFKTVLSNSGRAGSGLDIGVGLWRSTDAISSIKISVASGTFSAGTLSLYGIKAA